MPQYDTLLCISTTFQLLYKPKSCFKLFFAFFNKKMKYTKIDGKILMRGKMNQKKTYEVHQGVNQLQVPTSFQE